MVTLDLILSDFRNFLVTLTGIEKRTGAEEKNCNSGCGVLFFAKLKAFHTLLRTRFVSL
jgi:hypothetical protein